MIPFITHGGYGLGNSLAVVRQHAPQASIPSQEISNFGLLSIIILYYNSFIEVWEDLRELT